MSEKRTAVEAFPKSPEPNKKVKWASYQEIVAKQEAFVAHVWGPAGPEPLTPVCQLIADTFFDGPERFKKFYHWITFTQRYFDLRMSWIPFLGGTGGFTPEVVERFQKLEDLEERKAQVLAHLLTHSALHHYGSHELCFLLEYVFIPAAHYGFGMFPKKMRAMFKRVVEIMDLPIKNDQLSKGTLGKANRGSGLKWVETYRILFEACQMRRSDEAGAKKQIFYSFLWSIAGGGCSGLSMIHYSGAPRYSSLSRRDY